MTTRGAIDLHPHWVPAELARELRARTGGTPRIERQLLSFPGLFGLDSPPCAQAAPSTSR